VEFIGMDSGPAWVSLLSDCKKTIYHHRDRIVKSHTLYSMLDDMATDKIIEDREEIKNIPVHFLTIVLNGMPWIKYHKDIFDRLPFNWKWHIVEGASELVNDTGWSVKNGGELKTEWHKDGHSTDGTLDYIKSLTADKGVLGYIKNGTWPGKTAMVNAPLGRITDTDYLLHQVDVDEFWTPAQLCGIYTLFAINKINSAIYTCRYFVGRDRITEGYYGNSSYEWIRTWRLKAGDLFKTHEPPVIGENIKSAIHLDTEARGLIFDHYAYVDESSVRFKEDYYGYKGLTEKWKELQNAKLPVSLIDYFTFVDKNTKVIESKKFIGGRKTYSIALNVIVEPGRLEELKRLIGSICRIPINAVLIGVTGEDSTIETFCKERKLHCVKFAWNDNFAEARNVLLNMSNTDFIMWIDSDDIIPSQFVDEWIKLINGIKLGYFGECDLHMIPYITKLDKENKPETMIYRERIFKKYENNMWVKPVHESIKHEFEKASYWNKVCVVHMPGEKKSIGRNISILTRNCLRDNDPALRFYLGISYYDIKNFDIAIPVLSDYVEKGEGSPDFLAYGCLKLARFYMYNLETGAIEPDTVNMGLQYAIKGIKFSQKYAELYTCAADGLLHLNKTKDAFEVLKRALQCKQNAGMVQQNVFYHRIPLEKLSFVANKLGEYELSLYYNRKALQIDPQNEMLLSNRIKLMTAIPKF
jgi:glycosyltransferase involved in cell wall biosynthesis